MSPSTPRIPPPLQQRRLNTQSAITEKSPSAAFSYPEKTFSIKRCLSRTIRYFSQKMFSLLSQRKTYVHSLAYEAFLKTLEPLQKQDSLPYLNEDDIEKACRIALEAGRPNEADDIKHKYYRINTIVETIDAAAVNVLIETNRINPESNNIQSEKARFKFTEIARLPAKQSGVFFSSLTDEELCLFIQEAHILASQSWSAKVRGYFGRISLHETLRHRCHAQLKELNQALLKPQSNEADHSLAPYYLLKILELSIGVQTKSVALKEKLLSKKQLPDIRSNFNQMPSLTQWTQADLLQLNHLWHQQTLFSQDDPLSLRLQEELNRREEKLRSKFKSSFEGAFQQIRITNTNLVNGIQNLSQKFYNFHQFLLQKTEQLETEDEVLPLMEEMFAKHWKELPEDCRISLRIALENNPSLENDMMDAIRSQNYKLLSARTEFFYKALRQHCGLPEASPKG